MTAPINAEWNIANIPLNEYLNLQECNGNPPVYKK